jgi:hypothetical protein
MESFFNSIPPNSDVFRDMIYRQNTPSIKNLDKLFRLLQSSYRESKKIKYTIEQNRNHFTSQTQTKTTSPYFPKLIQNLIHTQTDIYDTLIIHIGHRVITINFIFMKGETYPDFSLTKYTPYLLLWFTLMNKIAPHHDNNHTLTIDIYMTKEKKEFPPFSNIVLNGDHINSALTYACVKKGSIIIYREEEWFKVLLHECMHSFCLDFSLQDQSIMHECLLKRLPIYLEPPQYSETYAEVWAEVLNATLAAFFIEKEHFHTFSLLFEFYIQLEIVHAKQQACAILKRQGISFDMLGEKHEWHQETHVYEYHILKMILLFSVDKFIDWCAETNGKYLIPFNETAIHSLCRLIVHSYESPHFIKFINKKSLGLKSNSLRMSICEI